MSSTSFISKYGAAAGKSEVKDRLCEILESVLGLSPVSSKEAPLHFESYAPATIQLLQQEIQNSFGRDVTLVNLIRCPTLDSLTDFISEESDAAAWSSIVPFQAKGQLEPFFCIHGAGGDVSKFQELSRVWD